MEGQKLLTEVALFYGYEGLCKSLKFFNTNLGFRVLENHGIALKYDKDRAAYPLNAPNVIIALNLPLSHYSVHSIGAVNSVVLARTAFVGVPDFASAVKKALSHAIDAKGLCYVCGKWQGQYDTNWVTLIGMIERTVKQGRHKHFHFEDGDNPGFHLGFSESVFISVDMVLNFFQKEELECFYIDTLAYCLTSLYNYHLL